MMYKIDNPNMQKIYDLWLSNDLENIISERDKFNIFNVLKLNNAEIRHSNFLAWLMTPRESHNIVDYFLKAFLEFSIKDFINDSRIKIDPIDILGVTYYDCEIRREYCNIDILIINPDNKFVCVIENKIWSGEHSQQLERYAQIINNEFKGYKKLYLFLTPQKDLNETLLKRDNVYYIQVGYENVIYAIDRTLKHRSNIMPNGVRLFIEHYRKMVERDIMRKIDENVVISCRRIYRTHKEAIDLITACTNLTEELTDNIKDIFTNELDYISDGMFSIKALNNANIIKHGDSKYGKDLILLQLEKNSTGFSFCINIATPENGYENERKNLIDFLENKLDIKFNHNQQKSWHYYNKQVISSDKYYDFETLDSAKIYLKDRIEETGFIDGIRSAINDFVQSKV